MISVVALNIQIGKTWGESDNDDWISILVTHFECYCRQVSDSKVEDRIQNCHQHRLSTRFVTNIDVADLEPLK